MAGAGTTITGIQAMAISCSTITVAVMRCATTTAVIGVSVATIGTARTEAVMMLDAVMVGAGAIPIATVWMQSDGRSAVVAGSVIETVTVGIPTATADVTATAAGKVGRATAQTLFPARTPMPPHADAVMVVVRVAGVTDAMDMVSPHPRLAIPISQLHRS